MLAIDLSRGPDALGGARWKSSSKFRPSISSGNNFYETRVHTAKRKVGQCNMRRITLVSLLFYLTTAHYLTSFAGPTVLKIDRWESSKGLSPEAVVSSTFERNLGTSLELINVFYQDLRALKGTYLKKKLMINKTKFQMLSFGTDSYDYNDSSGALIHQPLQIVAFYGFEQDQVSQYCIIEPLYESIEPKIAVVQSMSLVTGGDVNTPQDDALGLHFYQSQNAQGYREYYALMRLDDKMVLFLDAYLSEEAFLALKPEILEYVRASANTVKRFHVNG